jgi:predicted lipid-binding transport protein (Tim44 family)
MAFRHKALILAFIAALALGAGGDAFARAGSGFSFGSRGARTYSMPPATQTAPQGAAPMDRSWASPNDSIFRRPPAYSQGGLFSGGFGRGLLGGFLGAGLFGLLFGHGFFGGFGGGLSLLGFALQLGLLFLLFKLVMGFLRGRGPLFQGAGFGTGMGPGTGVNPRDAFAGFAGAGPAASRPTKLDLTQADFSMFEQRLTAVQSAFSTQDLERLRALATPEIVSYFSEQLAANAGRGLVNKISDVRFLQGDLSEAWRERETEYATVAMRFSLIDVMADRASGNIVSGDPHVPQEVTEVWTFARRLGGAPGDWKLSAIQQA